MYGWTVAGRSRTVFGIVAVTTSGITVKTEKGKDRLISRSDFEKVFELWQDYKKGNAQRKELRDLVFNSAYVLGILHWTELQT